MKIRGYMPAARPANEDERLAALRRYQILDTGFDATLDRIARVLANTLEVPISLVSLVDAERQWFKARVGLDVAETPRDMAFCSHAIMSHETFVVEDATQDERFAGNPLVVGDPQIRFYAGVPLVTPEGHALGTLCAIDRKPRHLDARQHEILRDLAALARDHVEVYRHAADAAQLLLSDPLTGLGNRSHARGFFDALIATARRHKRPFVAAYIDCDNFKSVNDQLGHVVGDAVLLAVGKALQHSVRSSDLAARMGGDEFLVILAETGSDTACIVLERIKSDLDAAMVAGHWPITFSIGATVVSQAPDSLQGIIAIADEALYEAKRAGKNRIVLRA
jgi:diguanylate cyclase (GGDEF)-like protein